MILTAALVTCALLVVNSQYQYRRLFIEIERAQAAAKKAQFKVSKVLQFSVFAERDSYSVIVRCVPEQKALFFVVAGPRNDRTASYVEDVANAF